MARFLSPPPLCLVLLAAAVWRVAASPLSFVSGMHGQRHFGQHFQISMRQAFPSGCSSHFYNDQRLDHFSESDDRTFSQRYIMCQQYAAPNDDAPALIQVGGEGPVSTDGLFLVTTGGGLMRNLNGVYIELEHRYYGASYPAVLPNASTENLQYLTPEQALADTKQFIEYISNIVPQEPDMISTPPLNLTYGMKNTRWAVTGGSYPGSLAAWMKEKYGDVISGAISYSGPLSPQYDYHAFFTVLSDNMKNVDVDGSDACFNFWDDALNLYASRWLDPNGKIPAPLKPCDDAARNASYFLDNVIDDLLEALTGTQNVVDSVSGDQKKSNIRLSCMVADHNMRTKGGTWNALNWLVEKAFFNDTVDPTASIPKRSCLNITTDDGDALSVVTWPETPEEEATMAGRLWAYQYCHQFGYLEAFFGMDPQQEVPAWKVFNLFTSNTLEYKVNTTCAQYFEKNWTLEDVAAGVEATNSNFAGRQIQVTNVTFVNEGLDPWQMFGITPPGTPWHNYCPDPGNRTFCNQNENLVPDGNSVLFVPLGSHCMSTIDLTPKSNQLNPKVLSQWNAVNAKVLDNLRKYLS
uniref:Uncharacterized protein n=1 Tax=Picochlorum oklahomense TaxID=249345 RepID=A0A7S1GF22_9CHLO|mmetsp:Transcript_1238/g.2532  ORF Transcript_1238/g.2532 Transcript_1238/m.2532 type:complete len:578 (+) Transcript_1238:268-2001(+)